MKGFFPFPHSFGEKKNDFADKKLVAYFGSLERGERIAWMEDVGLRGVIYIYIYVYVYSFGFGVKSVTGIFLYMALERKNSYMIWWMRPWYINYG